MEVGKTVDEDEDDEAASVEIVDIVEVAEVVEAAEVRLATRVRWQLQVLEKEKMPANLHCSSYVNRRAITWLLYQTVNSLKGLWKLPGYHLGILEEGEARMLQSPLLVRPSGLVVTVEQEERSTIWCNGPHSPVINFTNILRATFALIFFDSSKLS